MEYNSHNAQASSTAAGASGFAQNERKDISRAELRRRKQLLYNNVFLKDTSLARFIRTWKFERINDDRFLCADVDALSIEATNGNLVDINYDTELKEWQAEMFCSYDRERILSAYTTDQIKAFIKGELFEEFAYIPGESRIPLKYYYKAVFSGLDIGKHLSSYYLTIEDEAAANHSLNMQTTKGDLVSVHYEGLKPAIHPLTLKACKRPFWFCNLETAEGNKHTIEGTTDEILFFVRRFINVRPLNTKKL